MKEEVDIELEESIKQLQEERKRSDVSLVQKLCFLIPSFFPSYIFSPFFSRSV